MIHIGIDVHKAESQICALHADGEVVEKRIRTERDRFTEFFGRLPKSKILIESSTESEWVARVLEGLGHEVIVADPNFAAMYATRGRRVKTDRRDARALAEACRSGIFRPAHRLSDEQRQRRNVLISREKLVRMRSTLIVTVRALLRGLGIGIRTGEAESFGNRVRALIVPPELSVVTAALLTTFDTLNTQIAALDKELETIAKGDERVSRLMTTPGVGPITAIAFLAAIDDPERFDDAGKVAAYLGLVPGEDSSGGRTRRTSITKAGSGMVRYLLVQAALTIMRRGKSRAPALHAWVQNLATTKGSKIARVALARKLSGILFAMLRDGAKFDPRHREVANAA